MHRPSNTYTNKTWSNISGISLKEINELERGILLGIDFCLHVNRSTYELWLNLLEGFVFAKERDGNIWENRQSARASALLNAWPTACAPPAWPHHVRPSSRSSRVFCYPLTFTPITQPISRSINNRPFLKSGAKRPAVDTFCPISASVPLTKAQRCNPPASSQSVSVPPVSHSPPDFNHGFELGSPVGPLPFWTPNPQVVAGPTQNTEPEYRMLISSSDRRVLPRALCTVRPLQGRERTWAMRQVRTRLFRLGFNLRLPTLNTALTELG